MSIHWNHNHEDMREGERKGGEHERERERERAFVLIFRFWKEMLGS